MKSVVLLLGVLLVAGCAGTPGRPETRTGSSRVAPGSSKVFNGPSGVVVSMVTPAARSGQEVLIRVTGSNSEFDGLVLAAELVTAEKRKWTYRTKWRGRNIIPLAVLHPGTEDRHVLHVVGRPGLGTPLTYDEAASAELDGAGLVEQHQDQRKDGTLAAKQDFDRAFWIRVNEERLAPKRKKLHEACGPDIAVRIDWEEVPDELFQQGNPRKVSTLCSEAFSSIRAVCEFDAGRAAVTAHIREVLCRYREGVELSFGLEDGRFVVTFPRRPVNVHKQARAYLRDSAPLVPGTTLGERLIIERTRICTDGNGRYVGIRPWRSNELPRIFFGDDKKLILTPEAMQTFAPDFFDPREPAQGRGLNRYRSALHLDTKRATCALRCGKRRVKLELLTKEASIRMLDALKLSDPPPRRRPYALARDRKGTYYFVDVGDVPGARDFRVFRGPKGNLKQMEMTNVVKDSKGDIFTTRSGKLRLILEEDHSFWIRGKLSQQLVNVPLEANLDMIFNELGPYIGVPFGTPCDIF